MNIKQSQFKRNYGKPKKKLREIEKIEAELELEKLRSMLDEVQKTMQIDAGAIRLKLEAAVLERHSAFTVSRLSEIPNNSEPQKFRHCSGELNPAMMAVVS